MNSQSAARQQDLNIFDDLRYGFEHIAKSAEYVKIHHSLVASYADTLPDAAPENTLDEKHHYFGNAEQTACYILTLDSVNFGSGYEPFMRKEGWSLIDHSIYYTLSTRLKVYFEENGVPSAEQLASISIDDCLKIFELNEAGHYCREFAGLCAMALRELGQVVLWEYDGHFLNMVRAANGSAELMVANLIKLHHFNDVHSYHGQNIAFYKRAQITVADLHLAFAMFGETLFTDIEQLTMFPDNGVPHVLRMDGLLEYTKVLADKIDGGEDITSGSDEEIEIRACAAHVVEMIAQRKQISAMTVDHILWHKSVEDQRYREKQPHRTISQFY